MRELDLDAIETRYREYASACDRGYRSGLFVAAVADDVPALLAEVERLQREREEFRDAALLYAAMVAETRGGEPDA